uniref:VWFA domain-containing protein n=1 Tax=Rhabditophanes sp. KR3021 TaxID=114890 RepID=A0AC35TK33_9BILA
MSPSFPGWHMLFTTPKPNPVKQIPVKAPPTKAPIKKGPPTKAPIAKGSGNIVNSMNPFDEPTPPKKLPKIVITGVKAKSKIPHKKKIFKVQDGTNVPIKKVVSKKVNNTTKFNIRPVKIITPEAEQKPKAKAPIDEEIITTSSTKQPRKKTTTLTTTPGSDVNAKSTIPGTTEPENEEEEETTTEMPLTTAVSDSISTTSSVSTVKRTRRTRKPTTPSTTIEPDYEEETEPSPPTSTIEPTVVTRGTIKTSLTTPGTTSEPAEIEEGERTVHTRTTTTKKTRKQSTTASLTTTTEPEKIEEEGTTALTRRTRKPTTVPTSTKANESPTSTTTEPDYYSEEIEETASTKRFRKTTISDHIDTGESTTAEVPVSEEEQSSTTRRSRTKLATTAKPPSIKPNKDGLGIDWNEIDINAASGLGLISKGLKNKIPPGNVLVPKKGTQIGEEDGYYPIYYSTKDKHLYTYDDNNKRYKVHLDEDEIPFTLKDGIVSPGYTLTNGIPKFGKKTNKENVNVNVNITIIIDEISKLSPKDPSFISIYDKKETEELVDYSFGRGVNLASLDMHKATGMDNINAGKGINVKPGYIMIPHYGINYEGKIHPGYIDKKGNPVMFNDNGREIEIFLTSDGKPVTVNEKGETFYGFIENEDGTPEWGKIGASFAKECIDVEAMLKEIEALGPSSPAYYFIYDSDGPDSIKKPKSANVQKVITLKNNTNVILGSGLNWDNIDKRRAKGLEDINAGFAVDIPEGMVVVPEIAVQLDNENKRYHVVLIDSVGNMGAINDNGEFEPVYVNELGIPATKNGEGRFVPGLKRMGHNVVRGSSDEDFKTVKKDPFTVAQANFDLGEDNIGYYTITKPVPNKGLAISSIDIEFGLGIKWKQFDLENSIGLGK